MDVCSIIHRCLFQNFFFFFVGSFPECSIQQEVFAADFVVWFGVLFVRQGIYKNGIFKFVVNLPEKYLLRACSTVLTEHTHTRSLSLSAFFMLS